MNVFVLFDANIQIKTDFLHCKYTDYKRNLTSDVFICNHFANASRMVGLD